MDINTIQEMFNRTAEKYPDNRCFVQFEKNVQDLTYKEANTIVLEIANYLIAEGVKPNDNIGLTGKNSPNWALTYLGILQAGAVVIPVDHGIAMEKKLAFFKFANCKMIFSDVVSFSKDFRNISLSMNDDENVLTLNGDSVKHPKRDSQDRAAILFTSGTTGDEKGVILTQENLIQDVYLSQKYMELYPTDVFYALLPIHHSYCMSAVFLQAMSIGSAVVFAKSMAIDSILKELKEGKVTMFLGIPLLFNKLLAGMMKGIKEKGIIVYGIIKLLMNISGLIKKYTGYNPGKKMFKSILKKVSLDTNRICICGGGPLPIDTFKKFNQLGIDFVQGYGLTETSPIICLNPIYAYKESSVGKVIPNCDMIITDQDDNGIGEIAVKGPMVFNGYYQNEKATEEAFNSDGYFLTGDMGYLDKDNYLAITGRKKSLIVTEGGKNVYPEEIEDKFQLFFEIEQVMIKGFIKGNGEHIEVLFYPDQAILKEIGVESMKKRLDDYTAQVNRELMPYQRIERVKILEKPLEITTTKKIKRHKIVD